MPQASSVIKWSWDSSKGFNYHIVSAISIAVENPISAPEVPQIIQYALGIHMQMIHQWGYLIFCNVYNPSLKTSLILVILTGEWVQWDQKPEMKPTKTKGSTPVHVSFQMTQGQILAKHWTVTIITRRYVLHTCNLVFISIICRARFIIQVKIQTFCSESHTLPFLLFCHRFDIFHFISSHISLISTKSIFNKRAQDESYDSNNQPDGNQIDLTATLLTTFTKC